MRSHRSRQGKEKSKNTISEYQNAMSNKTFQIPAQTLWAVSSKDGTVLWKAVTDNLQPPCASQSTFQSVQIVADISGDQVPDIIAGIQGEHLR